MNLKDAIGLAIKSLEGKTVFPNEASQAATLLRASLIRGEGSPTQTEFVFRDDIGSVIHTIRKVTRTQTPEQMERTALEFERRLTAAGLDSNAVRDEISTALATGGLVKAQPIIDRVMQQVMANEKS